MDSFAIRLKLAPSKGTTAGSSLTSTRLHKQRPLEKAGMKGVQRNLWEGHSRMGWDLNVKIY